MDEDHLLELHELRHQHECEVWFLLDLMRDSPYSNYFYAHLQDRNQKRINLETIGHWLDYLQH